MEHIFLKQIGVYMYICIHVLLVAESFVSFSPLDVSHPTNSWGVQSSAATQSTFAEVVILLFYLSYDIRGIVLLACRLPSHCLLKSSRPTRRTLSIYASLPSMHDEQCVYHLNCVLRPLNKQWRSLPPNLNQHSELRPEQCAFVSHTQTPKGAQGNRIFPTRA
jgi:hypothetical protein